MKRFDDTVDRAREDPFTALQAFETFRAVTDEKPWTSPNEQRCKGYAFEAMGHLGVLEAVPYLDSFVAADFEERGDYQTFGAVRFAFYDTLLAQISTQEEKVRFFQDSLEEEVGYAASWAANRVCNTGLLVVLPAVRHHLIEGNSSGGEEDARFCEARMRALEQDPDRVSAVAAILQIPEEPADTKLMQWALWELMAMKLPRANEQLERFEREVLALPETSPQYRTLIGLADEIWAYFGFPGDRRYYPNGKERTMRVVWPHASREDLGVSAERYSPGRLGEGETGVW